MNSFRIALLVLCSALLAAKAPAQSVDNLGTEFYCAFLPNPEGGTPAVELHLSSPVATTVQVEYPAHAPTFSTSVAVSPASCPAAPRSVGQATV
jgi:hypothetical protein